MPFKSKDDLRRYQREWQRDNRKRWLDENGPCAMCGSADNLQVDHIKPGSKISHRIWTWAKERRKKELDKCQVLCRPCHIKKSMLSGERAMTDHGRGRMYQAHKCRCEKCRAWKREADKRHRKAKKERELGGTGTRLESDGSE